MTIEGAPTWRIDTLTITAANSTDSLGRQWIVDGDKGEAGWDGAPAPRTNRTARPNGMGSYRSASFAGERSLTLAGSVWCPSVAIREQTALELAALCRDGGQLYTYRRTTDAYDLTCDVERADETLVTTVTKERLDWSFHFIAPDPRKHDYLWQRVASTLPQGGSGGFDPVNGLLPTADYFDEGVLAQPAIAEVANFGTAPAYPVFEVDGAVTQPVIYHLESGKTITYAGIMINGDVLTVNCDEFPAMGLLSHSALLNGTQNVRPYLAFPVDWPVIDPQDVGTFQLLATGTTNAQLVVALRSAYY